MSARVGKPLRRKPLILAGERHDMPIVVRTPWAEPGAVMQILDAGAAGIIIPMINTVEDAIEAVSWTRYPPEGVRSLGTVRAAMGDAEFSLAKANEDVLVFVMIETKQYIVTMNSDIFDALPLTADLRRDEIVLETVLSDATETGGLFGISFA